MDRCPSHTLLHQSLHECLSLLPPLHLSLTLSPFFPFLFLGMSVFFHLVLLYLSFSAELKSPPLQSFSLLLHVVSCPLPGVCRSPSRTVCISSFLPLYCSTSILLSLSLSLSLSLYICLCLSVSVSVPVSVCPFFYLDAQTYSSVE